METEAGGSVKPLIQCENISLGYGGQIILRDFSLSVYRGDYLCLVGENGSGKTTLLKGLLGLLLPASGTILRSGKSPHLEAGYLSQEDVGKKDFPASVREIVLSGNLRRMGLRPFYSRSEKQRAGENMALLGIADMGEKSYQELSGGQRRRVLLARSLCAAEELLALDEPAAGLDPLITLELYTLLENINREKGMTIIMVSHDLEAAKKYAGRIINLGRSLPNLNSGTAFAESMNGRNVCMNDGGKND
jgi:zinc transport system ATP-binding protein